MAIQQFDTITLKHLAGDLHRLLHRAKITRIQQWTRTEFVVSFWFGSVEHRAQREETEGEDSGNRQSRLYINLSPEFPCCFMASPKELATLARAELQRPTGFCMALRKHLTGALIYEVRSLPGEQVLDFVFEHYNELGNRVRLVLSLELMGKYTNMILYDAVQGTILASAHSVTETMSSQREVAVGLPYRQPPRPAEKILLSTMSTEAFQEWLAKNPPPAGESSEEILDAFTRAFWGIRRGTVAEADAVLPEAVRQNPQGHWLALFRVLQGLEMGDALTPAVDPVKHRFTLLAPGDGGFWERKGSVSALVHDYALGVLGHHRLSHSRRTLLAAIDEQEKKRLRHYKGLVPVSDETIRQLQEIGDSVLCALSQELLPSQPPASGVYMLDLIKADGSTQPMKIAVDPAKTWSQNAQDYYRKARKAKSKKAVYEERLEALENQKAYLEELRNLVNQADSLAELDAIWNDLVSAGILRERKIRHRKRTKGKAGEVSLLDTPGLLVTESSDGFPLLVGKSSKANALLVGKLARPGDRWFHVHNMPGSHVLVKCGKQDIPNQTILEAANLAVYYSSARQGMNVPVIYTDVRFVRKIPNSYPGHVNYREEEGVFITVDEGLVRELMGRKQSGDARSLEHGD